MLKKQSQNLIHQKKLTESNSSENITFSDEK